MYAEFKHTLGRMRGQVFGWGIGLALYALMMSSMFDSIAGIEGLMEVMKSYPEELLAFFGDIMAINTPIGYLDIYYFSYMTMIIGIFAIGACANLLVADEEKGILDLVLAHPISRSALYWGRLLGFIAAMVIVLLLGWLSWVLPSAHSGMDLNALEFLSPFLPLFALLLLFGTLGLLLSMVLPSGRTAAWISGALLVANFLLLGLSETSENLQTAVKFTPLYYHQGGDAVVDLNLAWLGGLLGASVLLALVAWLLFRRREIRVGGERSWKLPSLARLRRIG